MKRKIISFIQIEFYFVEKLCIENNSKNNPALK